MITHLFTCQVSFFEQLLQSQMAVNRTSRNWVCHQHRSRCFWHFLAKVGWGYRCETAHFFAPQYPQQQRTKGIPTNVYTPKTRLLAIQEPTKITHLHYHPEKKKKGNNMEKHGKTWNNHTRNPMSWGCVTEFLAKLVLCPVVDNTPFRVDTWSSRSHRIVCVAHL